MLYYFLFSMIAALILSPIMGGESEEASDGAVVVFIAIAMGIPSYLAYRDFHAHKNCFARKKEAIQQTLEAEQQAREDRKATLLELHRITPQAFERVVASILKRGGYDVTLTPVTGDFGVDVVAVKQGVKTIVEVKQHSAPVGPAVVRGILGAMHRYQADLSMVVSLSGYTPAAQETARGAPVSLWGPEELLGEVSHEDLRVAGAMQ